MPPIPLPRMATASLTRWTPRATQKRPCSKPRLDIEQGADLIMVKPAAAYLDIIAACRNAL